MLSGRDSHSPHGLTGSPALLSSCQFSVGWGDLNCGPGAYAASVVLAKPSLQPSVADVKFMKAMEGHLKMKFHIGSVPVHKRSLIFSTMTTVNESRATWIWWHKPVILAPGRQGQEDL